MNAIAERERRPTDPTRELPKVFGVNAADEEARTAALLERAAARAAKHALARAAKG